MKPPRLPLVLVLAMVVSACGGEPPAGRETVLPRLETFTVSTAGAGMGAWDGVVEAVQQAELTAQTAGRVAAVAVDVGDRVQAGQLLLRLDGVEQQSGLQAAQAQLRAADAAAREAEASHARVQALAEKQYVSRLQLDQSRAARDAAVAGRDAARAQVAQLGRQADYTAVHAPFAGIVSARRVEPGESVSPGQALLVVHAPGALRLRAMLPPAAADAVRAAGKLQVQLADGRVVDAGMATVFPAADPLTHAVTVRVALPPLSPEPVPGASAKLLVPAVAGAETMMRIPRAAVAQRGELNGVYVLADGRLSLRQLRLGATAGDQVEVLAGLRAGEVVAADPVAAMAALSERRGQGGGDE